MKMSDKKIQKSPRRRAREFAVQALYQATLNQQAAPEIARYSREHTDFKRADSELFQQLFFGANNNQREYMMLIRTYLDRDEKLVNPIERAILLMATHELAAMPETPRAVVINEAIEVTKTFGGVDSHKFINSILDKIADELFAQRAAEATANNEESH